MLSAMHIHNSVLCVTSCIIEDVGCKTVKKYAKSRFVPKYRARGKKVPKLEPYKAYIKDMIDRYNLSAGEYLTG